MKILIGNIWMDLYTGSENFTFTLAKEFVRQGHDVTVFYERRNGEKSDVADRMRIYCDVVHKNNVDKFTKYDLILFNQPQTYIPDLKGFKVFTKHGPNCQHNDSMEIDRYVAVSEEVARLYGPGHDPVVIRNGIDCRRFYCKKPISEKLSKVLYLSNYMKKTEIIKSACESAGIEFKQVGGFPRTRAGDCFNLPDAPFIEDVINDHDLVITLGRGCYESLACKRNVIVFDRNGGDGFVTQKTILDFRHSNCSGRFNREYYTKEELATLFRLYNPSKSFGANMRDYVLQNNNVEKTSKQYLELVR